MRGLKFFLTGLVGLSVNLGVFNLLYLLGLPYLYGSVMSFLVAMVVGFLLQKYWTFEDCSRERAYVQFASYAALTSCNLLLNTFIVYALVDYADVYYLVAQATGAGLLSLLSYFVYRFYIFRGS
ncbi:GtrA family protein [Candidatus Nomurabacteria bacterium]|nr:GtrA family protein [Candidatus Nomurabacteria bacterium]